METIKQFIIDYLNNHEYGQVSLIIDAILVLTCLIFVIIFYFKHVKTKLVVFSLITYVILITITLILKLTFTKYIIIISLAVIALLTVLYYSNYLKSTVKVNNTNKNSKYFLSSEETKNELIDTLIKTVAHLSTRKIGAIITIEKEKSLNVFIEKAVPLNAITTFELLDTIFHPNTALHDGAVIIRGNHIMCAGAFYNPSDKGDIPQQFGSRHRAAIGISEESDAFTMVVSEETGKISTTIDGTITPGVSLESLRISLENNIIVQTK